ncbi:NAD(P)/FAD-dependent oxidoreductase [Streptomyces albireticuli]|uniref:Pyridine nucleotide-disulfide oxidoreductase n=1 Tax=Streptomyces albireticuli TaxID=1940 RepID=A0A2A2D521_9ACTN|nr:FAD-dependent monooxygenase [Streptomyces albireticuli]MCD9145986.1 FAD-dependent monooxygenase [Streptomyces albireticuli]MCD9165748.1 FAD-dependent monooxygenase [Streptomyces albireticuli]MCD9195966.1 FAD-dependent monooxygenase [Streptomyces albireticuli]PAU46402.1 pyridine nucleotide-disulfide oxidoreductase [Streptomyces albireticuli]
MHQPNRTTDHRPARHRRAVILGAGMTGMLAAAALAPHTDEIILVDRDELPPEPAPRKGLPQARHAHLLWSGGARTIESLLPGTHQRWLEAGARRIALPTGLASLSPQGWIRRWPEMQYLIACTRDLLDWVVREQALALPGVTLLRRTEPVTLLGNARHVTGVRVRDTADGTEQDLEAGLVVDATGRGSRIPQWLTDLGLPRVHEEVVDSGLVYATRIFRAPDGTEDFPVVNVQADTREPVPGQTATLVPIEDRRWLVTLSGTRGGEPTKDPALFEPFARQVRHPVVADLITDAEPLTDVTVTRSTVNRRRYYERLATWPAGLTVLGDAVATYNPVYGHGMSVAAHSAQALRTELTRHPLDASELARRVQRATGKAVDTAWALATGQDILYPGATGTQPPPAARLLRAYMDRVALTATGRPAVARALISAMTLSRPLTTLATPDMMIAALRGPGRRPLTGPPLTTAELSFQHARRARS